MKLFVVTKNVNAYDQYGSYFIGVFTSKPTIEQLTKLLDGNALDAAHVATGGGRRGFEEDWFTLHEVEEGENFERAQ